MRIAGVPPIVVLADEGVAPVTVAFVARVHREAVQPDQGGHGFVQSAASGNSIGSGEAQRARFASWRSPRAGQVPTAGNASRPETDVLADHHDLVNFLHDEFAKSCRCG